MASTAAGADAAAAAAAAAEAAAAAALAAQPLDCAPPTHARSLGLLCVFVVGLQPTPPAVLLSKEISPQCTSQK